MCWRLIQASSLANGFWRGLRAGCVEEVREERMGKQDSLLASCPECMDLPLPSVSADWVARCGEGKIFGQSKGTLLSL